MLWAASSLIINKGNKSWEVMSDTLLLMFQKTCRQALLPWLEASTVLGGNTLSCLY